LTRSGRDRTKKKEGPKTLTGGTQHEANIKRGAGSKKKGHESSSEHEGPDGGLARVLTAPTKSSVEMLRIVVRKKRAPRKRRVHQKK